MSEIEYITVILAYTEAFNTVFNFWLTITFSYLVAFFFMAARLDRNLRRGLVSLYAITSVIFAMRYLVLVYATGRFNQRMIEDGFEGIYMLFVGQQLLTIGGTFLLMVIGTVLAVVYSIFHTKSSK